MMGEVLIGIVDDDQAAREAAVDLVRALGFAAAGFDSADALLSSESLSKMGCLIADVRMPGRGGFELHLELLRSGIAIPTILMSAYSDEHIRIQSLKAGVRSHLAKPLEADHLLTCIRSAIAQSNEPEDEGP